MKSTWKVTQHKISPYKVRNTATYTGDLMEALSKAEADLQKLKNDKNIEHWEWIKKEADAKIRAHDRAIERAETFIRIAQQELKK